MLKPVRNAKAEYAKRLRDYRKAANVSQEDLAKATGVHQPYIADIEAGKISIGIDKQEEFAAYFGVKYYHFADPDVAIPSRMQLRENIREYVKSLDIDPGYLKNDAPNFTVYIDELLDTDFLSEPKLSKEIAEEMKRRYGTKITPSKVTDVLTKLPRLDLINVIRPLKGKGNRYQLKNNS